MFNFMILLFFTFLIGSQALPAEEKRGRIVGGFHAKLNQFPWQAAITLCPPDSPYCSTCGGSLISRRHILTAAHCTEGMEYFDVGLGSNSRFQSQVLIRSTQQVQHPQWNKIKLENDVAVITLPEEVNLSESIQIIPLASSSIGSLAGQNVTVSGFGKLGNDKQSATMLNYVGLRVIDNVECSKSYFVLFPYGKMCAVGLTKDQTICQGDSGGPLVLKQGDSFVQVGVVSFTYRGCVPGQPSGYARVSEYIDWIQSIINK